MGKVRDMVKTSPLIRKNIEVLLNDLGVYFEAEEGFSIQDGIISGGCWSIRLPTNNIGYGRLDQIKEILDFPDFLSEDLHRAYPPADTIRVGCEEHANVCMPSLSLEFWGGVAKNIFDSKGKEKFTPRHVLSMYRWEDKPCVDGSVDDYVQQAYYTPYLSPVGIIEKLNDFFSAREISARENDYSFEMSKAIMVSAAEKLNNNDAYYFSENKKYSPNERIFDINFYKAQIAMEKILPLFSTLRSSENNDEQSFVDFSESISRKTLGHVSGLMSNDNPTFLSLYYS